MILFWTSDRNCQEVTGKGEKLPQNCPAKLWLFENASVIPKTSFEFQHAVAAVVARFRGFGRLFVRFAGTRQAIDLPGSNGPEQFVRLKLLGQGDKPALLPGPDVQAVSWKDLQQVDFRDGQRAIFQAQPPRRSGVWTWIDAICSFLPDWTSCLH